MNTATISLAQRVVIITGAGNGIGKAAALAMAKAGAYVVVNDINEEAAHAVVSEIQQQGGTAIAVIAAIGTSEAADHCIACAVKAFGHIDVMVCNAGILRDRVLWNTSDEDFDAVVTTHLRGSFTCARAAAKQLRSQSKANQKNGAIGGRILLMSSIAGQRGNFGQTSYSAVKAGIAAMARTWSMELARDHITVNAIVPNALTAMTATVPSLAPYYQMMLNDEQLPSKVRQDWGIGTAEDIAPLFVYLASTRSAHISGQCIGIGGDKLSIWSHPLEAAFCMSQQGWSNEGVAQALEGKLANQYQSVGINFN